MIEDIVDFCEKKFTFITFIIRIMPMTDKKNPLKVEVTRGNKVESFHLVDAIVMNSNKEILECYGEAYQEIYPRSAIKLLQALMLVESGAYSGLELSLAHLALACSSHYADQVHTDVIHQWLSYMDLTFENLRCGPQMPSRESVRNSLIKNGLAAHRGHNNCSGKHAGILSVCKYKNYDLLSYDQINHPAQQELLQILSRVYEYDLSNSDFGIDGCGIPTIPVPLYHLNLGHINLLTRPAGKLILEAIVKYPELISGENNFCTEINRQTKGRVFAKTGAEGVYIAFSPTHNIFISLKVRDGGTRASQFAIASLLKQFDCIDQKAEEALEKFLKPTIKNWEGKNVGAIKLHIGV